LANNRVKTRTIVAKKRTESQTKYKQNTNKIQTKTELIRQATLTKINFTEQEPCQVSKVRQKNTNTGKNKYE
jgi:hypothetical protein